MVLLSILKIKGALDANVGFSGSGRFLAAIR
jgi:hypothetical protein